MTDDNWQAGFITVDEGGVIVPGEWRTDVRWNGWLCPRMKQDAVKAVLDMMSTEQPDMYAYEQDGDVFTLKQYVYETDDQYEPDVFEPDEDGWYSPGFMGWCWEDASQWLPEVPRSTFEISFAECPDCGGHRYQAGTEVNSRGQGMTLYCCLTHDHEPLADIDIVLEWNEDWTVADDGYGLALAIQVYDDLPTQDIADHLGVDSREAVGVVTWQMLTEVFGEQRVALAIKEVG